MRIKQLKAEERLMVEAIVEGVGAFLGYALPRIKDALANPDSFSLDTQENMIRVAIYEATRNAITAVEKLGPNP